METDRPAVDTGATITGERPRGVGYDTATMEDNDFNRDFRHATPPFRGYELADARHEAGPADA
jgi:hypothetical protein